MPTESKSYFAMEKGLNTEAPLINFPDGYTTDEQNYELTVKGERRRRLGLGLETDGIPLTVANYAAGYVVRSHDWENVAGNPSTNFVVMQVGHTLKVFNDANPTSTELIATIDFRSQRVSESLDSQIGTWPLESAFGRGHLFFFGKYTAPFYIEYTQDTSGFSINQISPVERDFQGIDDGYDYVAQPTVELSSHRYNLQNRGWTDALIDAYFADQLKFPSKAMIPWLGLKRALTAGNYYDDDGIRSFDPAKLAAEYFQDASSPTGHKIITPFDTSTFDDGSQGVAITTWTSNTNTPTSGFNVTFTIETAVAHGLAVSELVRISNLVAVYQVAPPGFMHGLITEQLVLNQSFTVVTVPDTTHLTITFPWTGSTSQGWIAQYANLGTAYVAGQANASGNVIEFRPKAGAFFAGRVWYAGIDTSRLTGRIYFSQVIESDAQYVKCYQIADPTDERISDLVPSDGGVIVIPEASNVLKLVPYNSSLLVYASNGIWEIGPGDLGYFAATSYSVRKVSDSGVVSSGAVVLMDNLPVYWGVTDIYGIAPNPQTGYLEVTNISQRVINTFYNDIPLECRRRAVGVYDDLSKRLIWLYSSSTDIHEFSYDRGLVYDSRLHAFIPFAFAYSDASYLSGIMLLKEAGQVSKVKYLGIVDGDLLIGEANNHDDYNDFGIGESGAYMVTGYDSVRQPSDFKMAPVVWVFSRKTETGYDSNLNAIRPSSTSMQSRWEWADNASAGRWGREQEIYRHQRTYVPVDSSDGFNDGVPVVVTKNKLRGKGRVLQLKFTAGTGKDSFLMGWKTNFTRIAK